MGSLKIMWSLYENIASHNFQLILCMPKLLTFQKCGSAKTLILFSGVHVGGRCSMIVCLVHADLHQDHVISQLRHVTSTSILVQHINSGTTGQCNGSGLCSITHQRKSGKVLRKVSKLYNLSPDHLWNCVWAQMGLFQAFAYVQKNL